MLRRAFFAEAESGTAVAPPPAEGKTAGGDAKPDPQKLTAAQVKRAEADRQKARRGPPLDASQQPQKPEVKRGRPVGSGAKKKGPDLVRPELAVPGAARDAKVEEFRGLLFFLSSAFESAGCPKPAIDVGAPVSQAWCQSAVSIEAKYGEIPYLTEVTFVGCTLALLAGPVMTAWDLRKQRIEAEKKKQADRDAQAERDKLEADRRAQKKL